MLKADEDLLRLAAKAAGLEFTVINECGAIYDRKPLVIQPYRYWNPLTDDGDALRLAVKTGVMEGYGFQNAWTAMYAVNKLPKDRCEAYRRAITQAAANLTGTLNGENHD